jgi:hypothetical protein
MNLHAQMVDMRSLIIAIVMVLVMVTVSIIYILMEMVGETNIVMQL